ncbi:hypothetical protein [Methyloceanibacter marginalis]|uniref:hypothetical protein n=1 Tax=Methyloceanibacter marginalis TaxID=1774971 RepID=UPI001FCD6D22|nr:hypothetical protein [Methyloceanibacter marginalis]
MAEHDTPRAEAPPSLKYAGWLKRPETVRVFAALSGDDIERAPWAARCGTRCWGGQ